MEPPAGAFAIEASLELATGTDPAAVGAAVTVELCGHWEHEPPCRWPHHTEVVASSPGGTVTRTVVAAGADGVEVESRIVAALDAGTAPGVDGSWTLVGASRVPMRPDEVELATRIGAARRP